MKIGLIAGICLLGSTSFAQIQGPKLSPPAEVKQTIGLTEVTVKYARPAKRGRVVFGDVVPYDEVWRTGANENTTFTTTDFILFGKDTLKAGTYALYTIPGKSTWKVIFYKSTDNWGTPDEWKEELVALSVSAPVKKLSNALENFTISFENVTTKEATLSLSWDQVQVSVNMSVPTDAKMKSTIETVMAGPSANDYYRAADYYLNEKIELPKALEYINKAIAMQEGEAPFWMVRRKSLIQAEMGDFKGAVATAKISLEGAKKAGHQGYIDQNERSIQEWSKK